MIIQHKKFKQKNRVSLPTTLQAATDYLILFAREQNLSAEDLEQRLNHISQEYEQTGTYWQTTEELAYGAKVAWRNSVNCIGRIGWQSLIVRDLRHLTTAEDIFAAIVEHINVATNQGKIRPTISIFAPQKPGEEGIRIWNPQFIRYVGLVEWGILARSLIPVKQFRLSELKIVVL